jgi:hypothetical protein
LSGFLAAASPIDEQLQPLFAKKPSRWRNKKSSRYVGKKERISSSFTRTEDTLMVALVSAPGQLPLIQFV